MKSGRNLQGVDWKSCRIQDIPDLLFLIFHALSLVMKLRGRVTRRLLFKGTKSEHEGLVLLAPEGEYKLRRQGGNPFEDKTLGSLEGKLIEGEGIVRKGHFIMSGWKTLE
jgi:hypothetical protein